MKNNKGLPASDTKFTAGVAHILVVILIVVAVVAGALYFYDTYLRELDYLPAAPDIINQETSDPVMAEPVSEDTSLDTIEAELEATIIGSPEAEIDAMREDASTL